MRFREFLELSEVVTAQRSVVNLFIKPEGKFLQLDNGRRVGPVNKLLAVKGQPGVWYAYTDKGQLILKIDPSISPKIVSAFYKSPLGIGTGTGPGVNPATRERQGQQQVTKELWWHRGVKAGDYAFLPPEIEQKYNQAEQLYTQYIDNGYGDKSPEVEQAVAFIRKYGYLVKGQFFSNTPSEAIGHAGPGGTVLSILLPDSVSHQDDREKGIQLKQGTARGVGPNLLLSGKALNMLKSQYPTKQQSGEKAAQDPDFMNQQSRQKFGM